MSFAAIPILITITPAPVVEQSEAISIRKLFEWAPFGLLGVFLISICYGIIFSMGTVYASNIGLNVKDVSYFMAAIFFGGLFLQWPLGRLSDKFDRRFVIVLSSIAAVVFAFLCTLQSKNNFQMTLIFSALMAGFLLPIYALFVALVNDDLRPEKILAASGTIVLVGSFGALIGPLLVALIMDFVGAQGFFWSLAGICSVIAIIGFIDRQGLSLSFDNQKQVNN